MNRLQLATIESNAQGHDTYLCNHDAVNYPIVEAIMGMEPRLARVELAGMKTWSWVAGIRATSAIGHTASGWPLCKGGWNMESGSQLPRGHDNCGPDRSWASQNAIFCLQLLLPQCHTSSTPATMGARVHGECPKYALRHPRHLIQLHRI